MMTRYFPEVVEQARQQLPTRCAVDGELIVIRRDGPDGQPRLDFELLAQRIHPAASRVKLLAETTPADFVAFDLLALDDESLLDDALPDPPRPAGAGPGRGAPAGARHPGHHRRRHRAPLVRGVRGRRAGRAHRQARRPAVRAGQAAHVQGQARPHRRRGGGRVPLAQVRPGGGLAAARALRRRRGAAPRRGERLVHHGPAARSCSTSWRPTGTPAASTRGCTATTSAASASPAGSAGGPARKNLEWEPVRPELVVEVAYDAMEGDRFRHTARFVRWRPDRDPRSCRYDQLDRPVRFDVDQVLRGDPAVAGRARARPRVA